MKRIKHGLLQNTSGLKKLVFCISLAVFVYIILSLFKIDLVSRIILGWDSFCISMILFSWILFFSTTQNELHAVV